MKIILTQKLELYPNTKIAGGLQHGFTQKIYQGTPDSEASVYAGISGKNGNCHTEIYRIEAGIREYPSIRILTALAKALEIPDHVALQLAGYKSEDDGNMPLIEKIFPELKTEKLRSTAQKIIDLLVKYSDDLDDSDYEGLIEHMEMFWEYTRRKRKKVG